MRLHSGVLLQIGTLLALFYFFVFVWLPCPATCCFWGSNSPSLHSCHSSQRRTSLLLPLFLRLCQRNHFVGRRKEPSKSCKDTANIWFVKCGLEICKETLGLRFEKCWENKLLRTPVLSLPPVKWNSSQLFPGCEVDLYTVKGTGSLRQPHK